MQMHAPQPPSWTSNRSWSIINLDKHQYVTAEEKNMDRSSHPSEMRLERIEKENDFSQGLWALIEPVLLPVDELLPRRASPSEQPPEDRSDTSGIFALPVDVIHHIFDAIENTHDATSLCLAHSHLFAACRGQLWRLTKRLWTSWAGDRLLVLPGRWDDTFWSIRVPEQLPKDTALMADIAEHDSFAAYLQGFTAYRRVHRALSLRELRSQQTQFDWRRSGGIGMCHFPLDIPWVICNLSKHEYVRMPMVMDIWNRDRQLTGNNFNRSKASMFTCRGDMPTYVGTSVPGRAVVSSTNKGQWAGDRMKICTLEAAKSEFIDWADWRDTTSMSLDPILKGVF